MQLSSQSIKRLFPPLLSIGQAKKESGQKIKGVKPTEAEAARILYGFDPLYFFKHNIMEVYREIERRNYDSNKDYAVS